MTARKWVKGEPDKESSPHWLDVKTPGVLQHDWADGTTVSYRDPSVSAEDSRATAKFSAFIAENFAVEALEKLKFLMAESNPLRFYLLIDALQRLLRLRGPEAHGYDALQEVVGGILASLPSDTVMAQQDTDLTERDFTRMELLLRTFAAGAFEARLGGYLDEKDDRAIDARFLLAAEGEFDRTAGYNENLRTIALDVLEQLDDLAPEIGFKLSDVPRAADAHLAHQIDRLQVQARQDPSLSMSAAAAVSKPGRSSAFAKLHRIANATRSDPVPVVVARLQVSSDAAIKLLDSISTPIGSQPEFGLTRSPRVRCFPVIKLPDGRFMWTSPQDFLHEILEWADLFLQETGNAAWRKRLSRARATTTERLTARALADVYGADRVARNLEYLEHDTDWVEVDALVNLGSAAVIVEAKSQRLTPQGRSAKAGRVRTKVDEFLLRPLRQTQRASLALRAGAPVKMRHKNPDVLRPTVTRALIVNLDRVDPFVTHARNLVDAATSDSGTVETDAWIVCLADLLTTTHLLRTPAELWAYHGKRIEQISTGSPLIYTETDALAAWLKTREGAWPTREGHLMQLAFSSGDINDYYNQRDAESHQHTTRAAARPVSRIPEQVQSTLAALIDDEHWAIAADAVANVPPEQWLRLPRDMQRLEVPPRTRSQHRSRAAVERGISYGSNPTVVVRPGEAPHVYLTSETDDASTRCEQGPHSAQARTVVNLIVPRN